MFEALATAIQELEIGIDEQELTAVAALRDRLDAKLAMAVASFDGAELWDIDGSVSMIAWLRVHTGMTQRDATRVSSTARRLRGCPLTSQAWVDGEIDGGQVAAIVANVTEELLPLYAERERPVLLALRNLDAHDSVTYLRHWTARAKAELERLRRDDAPEPDEPQSAVHLSPLLDGRGRLDGDLDTETYDLVRTALRLAETRDADGDPARIPAQRRADALAAVCRYFVDHQQTRAGGRHRPHVNVVIDLDDLVGSGPGRTLDGLPLDATTMRRLLCDAGIHRVITDGPSSILDYGRTTRTIPARRLHVAAPARPRLPLPGLRSARRVVRGPPRVALGGRRPDVHVEPCPPLQPPPPPSAPPRLAPEAPPHRHRRGHQPRWHRSHWRPTTARLTAGVASTGTQASDELVEGRQACRDAPPARRRRHRPDPRRPGHSPGLDNGSDGYDGGHERHDRR